MLKNWATITDGVSNDVIILKQSFCRLSKRLVFIENYLNSKFGNDFSKSTTSFVSGFNPNPSDDFELGIHPETKETLNPQTVSSSNAPAVISRISTSTRRQQEKPSVVAISNCVSLNKVYSTRSRSAAVTRSVQKDDDVHLTDSNSTMMNSKARNIVSKDIKLEESEDGDGLNISDTVDDACPSPTDCDSFFMDQDSSSSINHDDNEASNSNNVDGAPPSDRVNSDPEYDPLAEITHDDDDDGDDSEDPEKTTTTSSRAKTPTQKPKKQGGQSSKPPKEIRLFSIISDEDRKNIQASSLRLAQKSSEPKGKRPPPASWYQKCSICAKEFHGKYAKKTWRGHMETHSEERKYACPHCPAKFRQERPRRTHIQRIHIRNKSLSCQFCPKKFFDQVEVTLHERIHTGEKPFVCDVCGHACATRSSLMNHRYKHMEKTFLCTECGQTFRNPKRLRLHVENLHKPPKDEDGQRIKTIGCDLCPKKFYNELRLREHYLRMHRKDALEEKVSGGRRGRPLVGRQEEEVEVEVVEVSTFGDEVSSTGTQ